MDKYDITFKTWNKVAELYQDKFMDLDLYDDTYDMFCQNIKKTNPNILEIGCGPGNITKYILSKRPDFKLFGIDIAPTMIELAKKNNPSADFKVMDCRSIDDISGAFDGILCGFCMPYLSDKDCSKLIKDSSSLLEKNGWLYFSIIEGNYQKSGYETGSTGDQTYVYYHQEDFFRRQLSLHDFEDIKVSRKKYSKRDGTEQIHIIFMAERK